MPRALATISLLCLLGAPACSAGRPCNASRGARTCIESRDETAALLGAALSFIRQEGWGGSGKPAKLLVVRTITIEEGTFENSHVLPGGGGPTFAEQVRASAFRHLGGLESETWRSFLRANAERTDHSPLLLDAAGVVLVDERPSSESGYASLFASYPGTTALLLLSMPGVNPNGEQAILYVEAERGWGDVSGYYLLLRPQGGAWVVVQDVEAWIS